MESLNEEQAIIQKIAETHTAMLNGALDREEGERVITDLEAKLTNGHAHEHAGDEWPDAVPLPTLPDAPPWDAELLPDVLRPAVTDISERMQCPPDYVAAALIVGIGSIIGRTCAIRPKRLDDWAVTPNLWGAAVGRPSELKTSAAQQALKPLARLEARAAEAFEQAALDRDTAKMELEAIVQKMRKEINNKPQNAKDIRAQWAHDIEDCQERLQELEKRKRLLLHDATVEKLGMILAENERGVMVFRDEFAGFLKSLDKAGRENDRSFYLESWNGSGGYSYDRVGRGTLYIKSACVSLFGTIQPGRLQAYLSGALSGGEGDDGLIQRFQLIVYPEPRRGWKNVDRKPDREALDAAFEIFERLDMSTPESLGAKTEFESLPFVRFDDDAQELFDEWREKLEHRLEVHDEHPAMEAHLAKFRSLMPSLALIFHLVDNESGPVGEPSTKRAIRWTSFLEAHARRVYASSVTPEGDAASKLSRKRFCSCRRRRSSRN